MNLLCTRKKEVDPLRKVGPFQVYTWAVFGFGKVGVWSCCVNVCGFGGVRERGFAVRVDL